VGATPPAGRLAVLAAGVAVVGAVALLAAAGGAARRAAVAAGAVGVVAVVLPALGIVAGADYLDARNVLAAVVPLAVAVAIGLTARGPRLAGLAMTAVLVAASLASVIALGSDPGAQRPGWNRVAMVLGTLPTPRAVLLAGGSRSWAVPLTFYLPHTGWLPRRGAPVREIDVVRRLGTTASCGDRVWWGALCNIPPDPRSRTSPAPGFRYLASRHVAGFAIDRFAAARRVRVYMHQPLLRPSTAPALRRKRHLLLTPVARPAIR
jgi:hypothetical protein